MLLGQLLAMKADAAPRRAFAGSERVLDDFQIFLGARQPILDRSEWLRLTHSARAVARRTQRVAVRVRRIDDHAFAGDLPVHVAGVVSSFFDLPRLPQEDVDLHPAAYVADDGVQLR